MVMANLHGQFDWTFNHLGNTHLGIFVSEFLERFSQGGKSHPKHE